MWRPDLVFRTIGNVSVVVVVEVVEWLFLGIIVGVAIISVSRCAHLRQSIEMLSVRMPRLTLKCFAVQEITLNGPSLERL